MYVNPQAGLVSEVATGGTAVTPVAGATKGIGGGFIQNPYDAADQGLGSAEVLYVDPINEPGSSPGAGNGTTFVLYPGQTWSMIAGQITPTRVNAASSGHKFSCVWWNQPSA